MKFSCLNYDVPSPELTNTLALLVASMHIKVMIAHVFAVFVWLLRLLIVTFEAAVSVISPAPFCTIRQLNPFGKVLTGTVNAKSDELLQIST